MGLVVLMGGYEMAGGRNLKNRAEYRTEVKTRLSDDVYERLQIFKELNYISSDSEALSRLATIALFGLIPAGFEVKE